jgi:hypothetical protein
LDDAEEEEEEEEEDKTMEESGEVEWEEDNTAIIENNHPQYYGRCTKDIEAPIKPWKHKILLKTIRSSSKDIIIW